MRYNTYSWFVGDLPVEQLSPVHPEAQEHHPSVCRHVSGLQFGEHSREQFLPKYPSLQTIDRNKDKQLVSENSRTKQLSSITLVINPILENCKLLIAMFNQMQVWFIIITIIKFKYKPCQNGLNGVLITNVLEEYTKTQTIP